MNGRKESWAYRLSAANVSAPFDIYDRLPDCSVQLKISEPNNPPSCLHSTIRHEIANAQHLLQKQFIGHRIG